jgi:hypothetical protein
MNKTSIILGAIATFSLVVAAACGSSSSGNNANGNDSGTASSSSGGTASSSSGSGGGSSGGTPTCTGSQTLCIGVLGQSCVDAGDMCLGTSVVSNACSATQGCSGGQVCCSSYVGSDGGVIVLDDAGQGGGMGLGIAVSVQCMAQCPGGGALSSQVCSNDEAGAGPACPTGTTCRDLLPALVAPQGIPNTLCLAPLPDAGAFRRPDASAGEAGTMESEDAASE